MAASAARGASVRARNHHHRHDITPLPASVRAGPGPKKTDDKKPARGVPCVALALDQPVVLAPRIPVDGLTVRQFQCCIVSQAFWKQHQVIAGPSRGGRDQSIVAKELHRRADRAGRGRGPLGAIPSKMNAVQKLVQGGEHFIDITLLNQVSGFPILQQALPRKQPKSRVVRFIDIG